MKKFAIQNDEKAVKLMAGLLVDRLLLDSGDEADAAAVEEWMCSHAGARNCYAELSDPGILFTRLRRYETCTRDVKDAFQELMHRVGEPEPPQEETIPTDSLP